MPCGSPRFPRFLLLASGCFLLAHAAPVSAGWLPLGGPGEPAIELKLDPSRPELLYARVVISEGPEEAVLWRSTDGGATWSNVQGGLERPTSALALDPADPLVIWVWTADGQLWRSGDGGDTWERRFASPANGLRPDVHQLLVAGDRVYRLASDDGGDRISVSQDGGSSFRRRGLLPFSAIQDSVFFHALRNELLSFDPQGLQVSTDEGLTWRVRSRYLARGFRTGRLAPSNPDILYAQPSDPRSCLVRSDDAGAHWVQPAQPRLPGTDAICYDLAVDPRDALHVWVAADVVRSGERRPLLFESRDGGATWSRPLRMPTLGVVAAGGDVLYTGGVRGLGLYVSRDGGRSWTSLHQRIAAGDLRQGFVAQRIPGDGTGRRLLALETPIGGSPIALHRSDGGRDWVALPFAFPGAVADAGRPMVLAVAQEGLLRSQDGGVTWQPVPAAPLGFFRSNVVDPRRVGIQAFENVGAFGSTAFWMSDDAGATWRRAGTGLPAACSHVASVDICPELPAYAVDPFDGRRRWASHTFAPFAVTLPVLSISEDSGATWRDLTTELPLVRALAPDPRTRNRILAGTNRGLFGSEDGGVHWRPLGDGLPADAAVLQLLWDGRSATWYAATGLHGIYRSRDDGASWAPLAGAPDPEAPVIALDPRGPAGLLAVFRGQGVWRWTP